MIKHRKYLNDFVFQKWIEEKLVSNLEHNSTVVMDNASYHNVQDDRRPTQATRKAYIQARPQRRNVSYALSLLKRHFLDVVKQQPPEATFRVDAILKGHGHNVLRLPPYHAELNPIELIWAELKGHVAKRNMRFRLIFN